MKLATSIRWLTIHTFHLSWLVRQMKGAPPDLLNCFGCGNTSQTTAYNERCQEADALRERLLPKEPMSANQENSRPLPDEPVEKGNHSESQKSHINTPSDQGQGATSTNDIKLSGTNDGQFHWRLGADSQFNKIVEKLEKALEDLNQKQEGTTFSQLLQKDKLPSILEKCKSPMWTGDLNSWKEELKNQLVKLNAILIDPPEQIQNQGNLEKDSIFTLVHKAADDMIKLIESLPDEEHFQRRQHELYLQLLKELDKYNKKKKSHFLISFA
ncbi:hypothetical protein PtA15_12A116 [Puccinia triticina]|uniref:Uncharacterized protein n=1 Tax=Puccinia triticina TaxID=208348 RepID=A0ABY7CYV2_9BASI|nr:uncharacterized protein PtA15_12A116 [Puccinia triticina]WAQ90130.1 hypothetical protein PtA15_12A116 [Puccinia triticina]WAR61415.1 hypothetical protein PtB15_12B100 [Puccinia triticina]